MREFRERRRLEKIVFSRPVFALFLCLVILLAFSILKVYKKSRQAVLRNQLVETEINNLEERKESLEASVGQLRSDMGIEKELREKFQIKKPDEDYVVILENTGETPPLAEEKKEGFFQRILNFFR